MKLLDRGIIELNSMELNQIDENKKSEIKIFFCGGCTNSKNYELAKLFSEQIEFSSEVENWFNQIK